MLSAFNRLGLPAKYAVISGAAGLIGAMAYNLLFRPEALIDPLGTLFACGFGGLVGGWIRKRRGKDF